MIAMALLLALTSAVAVPSATAPTTVAKAQVRAAVVKLSNQLNTEYPIAGIAPQYATALQSGLQQGRYFGLSSCELADRLQKDLQAVHKDLHLGVRCKRDESSPKDSRQTPIDAAQLFSDEPVFYVASTAGWVLTNEACQQVIAAMTLSAGAKYVIVDIRHNGGGAGIIGNLIASYFYPLEDGHVLVRGAFRDRSKDTLEGTYPYVPGPRLPDAKVFILVDSGTASAAEGFAFGLQHAGRAKVVGQTTAGAGIAVWWSDIGGGLTGYVPRKLILAPDGSPGWEGAGVKPDVVTEQGKEFETARALIRADIAAAKR